MKTIRTAVMLFMATALFMSCSKDKEKSDPPKEKSELIYVKYSVADGGDLLKLVDIRVEYFDNKGEVKTEAITALPWEKIYSKIKEPIPVNLEMALIYTKKEKIPVQESYVIKKDYGIYYKLSSGKTGNSEFSSTTTVSKDGIDILIESLVNREHLYTLNVTNE